jgi:phosphomevalonate kinase
VTAVVSADAPGKLFLTGEYAVLSGAPALVAAVDRRVEVRVRMEPGPETVVVESIAEGNRHTASRGPLPAGDAGAVLAALRVARARGLDVGRVDVTVDSRAFLLGGLKLGLGRSAATVTAAIAALVGSEDGFAGALEAHADFQGGRGSGGDVAASFHGGVVEVQRGDQRLAVTARVLPAALHLVAGYTGEPALTDTMLQRFAVARAPRVMSDLREAAERAARAIACADGAAFLAAIDAAGDLLAALGEEADIPIVTPALARLVAAARRVGAAAKPSGAGGGDCGIAFARSPEQAAAVREAWAAEGLVPLALSITSEGVRHGHGAEEGVALG